MNNANKLIILFFLFFSLIGCTQEKVAKDIYRPFRKSLIQRTHKSLTKHKMSTIVVNECIFNGFVLAIVDVNQQGKATFELVYASSEFFKEVFFEPLKTVDTSSLEKGKRYLIPISYKGYRSPDFDKRCKTISKELSNPIIGNESKNIDYTFKPFDFFWVTPIS